MPAGPGIDSRTPDLERAAAGIRFAQRPLEDLRHAAERPGALVAKQQARAGGPRPGRSSIARCRGSRRRRPGRRAASSFAGPWNVLGFMAGPPRRRTGVRAVPSRARRGLRAVLRTGRRGGGADRGPGGVQARCVVNWLKRSISGPSEFDRIVLERRAPAADQDVAGEGPPSPVEGRTATRRAGEFGLVLEPDHVGLGLAPWRSRPAPDPWRPRAASRRP